MTYFPRAGFRRNSVQAYSNVALETQVLSSTPEGLITLLFDGAISAVAKARLHLKSGDIPARGKAISKAVDIVDSGLKAAVDREAGGDVATSMVAAYELIIMHLVQANRHADDERLALAERLLKELGSAWREVCEPAKEHTTVQVQS